MRVLGLDMSNFRGLDAASFAFHPRLNVLVGVNGTGKTSVLHCLAALLSHLTLGIAAEDGAGIALGPDDIRHGAGETRNTIRIFLDGAEHAWTDGLASGRNGPDVADLAQARALADGIVRRLEEDENAPAPLAVFHPIGRNAVTAPLRVRKQHDFNQIAALTDSLTMKREESDFRLFFEWFREREDAENESFRERERKRLLQEDGEYAPDPQLEAVRTAIRNLMPGFADLRVKRRPRLRMVVMKDGEEFHVDELSDGEKCLLALVADMARRIAMAHPASANPLGEEAVFLIDEPDLHLHPAWQRMLVPRLLRTFPRSQFFLATHSPQILGEIPDPESIWIMRPGEQPCHPVRSYGLDVNEVLEEIMGAAIRPSEISDRMRRIELLLSKSEFDAARAEIRKLADETRHIPVIAGYNAQLIMEGEEPAC